MPLKFISLEMNFHGKSFFVFVFILFLIFCSDTYTETPFSSE